MKTRKKWCKRFPAPKPMTEINPRLVQACLALLKTGGTLVLRSLADNYESFVLEGTPPSKWAYLDGQRRIHLRENLERPEARFAELHRPVKLALFSRDPKAQKSLSLLVFWGIGDDELNTLRTAVEDAIFAVKSVI